MPPGDQMPIGRRAQHGFTLLATLALTTLLALGAAVIGPMWAQHAQRERERDLLRLGNSYAAALQAYWDASPGSVQQFPLTLEALTSDPRFPGTHRHLRKLYPDPLSPGRPWGLVRNAKGEVVGVFSQSDRAPLARGAVVLTHTRLSPAQRYSDWKFIAASAL